MPYLRVNHLAHHVLVPLIILIIGSICAVFLSQSAFGYGYGYGYGTQQCTGNAPSSLSAKPTRGGMMREVLSWNAVQFSDCSSSKPQYYEVKVLDSNGKTIVSYSNITTTSWPVSSQILQANTYYQFTVRAVSVDHTFTPWARAYGFYTSK